MKAIRHFGIVVSNMKKSLQFYQDLLGLSVVRTMEESGVYIDNLLSLQNVHVTTVKLSADGGATLIELLEFKSHRCEEPSKRGFHSLGPSHLAFTVDDLDEVYRHLSATGIPFNAPPQLSPDGYTKVTFCRDPEGNLIELVQELR